MKAKFWNFICFEKFQSRGPKAYLVWFWICLTLSDLAYYARFIGKSNLGSNTRWIVVIIFICVILAIWRDNLLDFHGCLIRIICVIHLFNITARLIVIASQKCFPKPEQCFTNMTAACLQKKAPLRALQQAQLASKLRLVQTLTYQTSKFLNLGVGTIKEKKQKWNSVNKVHQLHS